MASDSSEDDDDGRMPTKVPSAVGSPIAVQPRSPPQHSKQSNPSTAEAVVDCNRVGCRCKKDPDGDKNKNRTRRTTEADWQTVHTINISHGEIFDEEDALEAGVYEAELWMKEQSKNDFMPNWKCNENIEKKGRQYKNAGGRLFHKVSYRCRYRDLCDCNGSFRLKHELHSNELEIQWFVRGGAHGICC